MWKKFTSRTNLTTGGVAVNVNPQAGNDGPTAVSSTRVPCLRPFISQGPPFASWLPLLIEETHNPLTPPLLKSSVYYPAKVFSHIAKSHRAPRLAAGCLRMTKEFCEMTVQASSTARVLEGL